MEKKNSEFLESIRRLDTEVTHRYEERGENDRGMYATQEEVDALRSLAATLVMVFGPLPSIDY
jgi:hypothetical protein